MWSLSIEERYYIIFPIILFLIYKLKKRYLFSFLIIFTVFSMLLNVITLRILCFINFILEFGSFSWEEITLTSKKFQISMNTKIIGLSIILFSLILFNDSMINIFYTKFTCLLGVFLYLSKTKNTYKIEAINQIKNIQIHWINFLFTIFISSTNICLFENFEINVRELSFYVLPLSILFLFFISHLNWKFIEIPFQKNFTNKNNLYYWVVFLL